MTTRAAIPQADVARVLRACQRAGLVIERVVVSRDGVSIEAVKDGSTVSVPVEAEREVVL